MICVRENSEGEYAGVGGRIHAARRTKSREQTGVFTRHGIERIVRYAFELAQSGRGEMLASATKSNALQPLDGAVGRGRRGRAQGLSRTSSTAKYHVDALAARMVTHPQTLDVIVASNLFGDILTDLGAAISGSLGIAPGAQHQPDAQHPSMFEPIHGSAPDIAGKGIANPIGAIWAGALMLDHLGPRDSTTVFSARSSASSPAGRLRTPDLGGTATTSQMADAICR